MSNRFETLYSALANAPRLLIEADLAPVQGHRFQPTGFPDLGAAIYKRPDGKRMLLVESAQSMANRMEAVCWDAASDEIVAPLKGLPHTIVEYGNGLKTSSLQEAHRLSSARIRDSKEGSEFRDSISNEVGYSEQGTIDNRKVALSVFKRDPNSIIHGIFFAQKEMAGGRLRLQRLLSSFVEAENVTDVVSGGVKLDRVDPKGTADDGYGNVPFPRTEYAAEKIIAYFNLDLATLRGYGLGEAANRLLIALSLYKIFKVLETGMRFRTACDLDVKTIRATRPGGVDLSNHLEFLNELEASLPSLIQACEFGPNPVTTVTGILPKKKDTKGKETGGDE
jgi:CRISPR-associated protein Csb1